MKRATVLLALLLAVTGVLSGTATGAAAPAGTQRLQTLDQAILARLNATRVSHGLRPLVLSDELEDAAVFHSRAMLQGGFFTHESGDGSPFDARLKRFYRASGYDAWSVGENLLYSTAEIGPAGAIKAWLESPAHRDNLLAPQWREVGIGSVRASVAGGAFGGKSTWAITMDFGVRSGGTAATAHKIVRPENAASTRAKSLVSQAQKPVQRSIDRVLPLPTRAA